MHKKLKNIYHLYPNSFWVLIAAILFLSAAIFYLANFSSLSPQIVLNDCKRNSEQVSRYISDAGNTFSLCIDIITEFANDSGDDDAFIKNMNTVLERFVASNDLTVGYFYKINSETPSTDYEIYYDTKTKYHISRLADSATISGPGGIEDRCKSSREPFWISLHNYMTDVVYLSYVAPLYKDDEFLGFTGVNLDLDYLRRNCFNDDNQGQEFFFNMLVSGDYQVLIHPYAETGLNLTQLDNGAYYDLYRQMSDAGAEGYSVQPINGRTWVLAYTVLPTGQIYVTSAYRAYKNQAANYLTFSIAFLAVICIFLVQTNKRTGKTPFDYMSDFVLKGFKTSAPDMIRKRAALALYFSVTVSVLANLAFAVMTQGFNTVAMVYLALFLLFVAVFAVYLSRRWEPVALFVIATLAAPLIIHLYFGGFASGNTGSLLLWTSMSFVIAMLAFNARVGEWVFYLFVVLLFLDVLAEIFLFHNTDYYSTFTFVTALFLLGFANFTSMNLFTTLSEKDYNESILLLEELRHTQSQLVQREKMVTLGQLIAGIAHEINTPMGAIKASSEVLDSSLNTMVSALITEGKNFSDEDHERLLMLVGVAKASADQMRSTMEVRRAKTQLREFFSEREISDGNFIADTLTSLEICDLEWVRDNVGLFESENIINILKVLKKLSPVINGTQTIGFASEKISKIVFALRSYAHTSVSEEHTLFDLAGTIDNVLVLCHHQLKHGIEVIRIYDDDLPEVQGNPDEIGQIWTNLIQNAIFAMNGAGKLTVTVRREGDYLVTRFSDTGAGIAPEIQERIFEPFYTTKPLGEGSGLGLDICRKIALDHGGELTLETSGAEGSTFMVRLPVYRARG